GGGGTTDHLYTARPEGCVSGLSVSLLNEMSISEKSTRGEGDGFSAGLDDFLRALRTARGRFNKAPLTPELSASQLHLLEPLVTSGGRLSLCALAEAADVAAPTASRMLDGLVERGLAERIRPQDG